MKVIRDAAVCFVISVGLFLFVAIAARAGVSWVEPPDDIVDITDGTGAWTTDATDVTFVQHEPAKFKQCLSYVACNGEGFCLCEEDVPEELWE